MEEEGVEGEEEMGKWGLGIGWEGGEVEMLLILNQV